MTVCPLHADAVCLLTTLRAILEQHGEITLRHGELPDSQMGRTIFDERHITLAPNLSMPEWRSTLVHELVHLRRGPVPHGRAAEEEAAVQREAAAILVPSGAALAQLDRQLTDHDVQIIAARHAVDHDTVLVAVGQRATGVDGAGDVAGAS